MLAEYQEPTLSAYSQIRGRNMRVIATVVCCLLVVSLWRLDAEESDEARATIKRAVTAAGGKEKLAHLLNRKTKSKGVFFVGDGKPVSFTSESWVALPLRFKGVMRLERGSEFLERVRVLNVDMAWEHVEGKTARLDANTTKAFKESQHYALILMLYPLLEDPQFSLKYLGEERIGGRMAIGITVSAKGRPNFSLFVDKKSNLVVKTSTRGRDFPLDDALTEISLDKHREIAGVIQPSRRTYFRDGVRYAEDEVLEMEPLARIDPSLFREP